MPATAKTARRRRSYAEDVTEAQRVGALLCKEAAVSRLAICCGPHMLGRYPADAIETVLADLTRWAADPGYFPSLPWPPCCDHGWAWDVDEELAVWRSGRVVAIVRKTATGRALVKRFDVP